MAPASHVLALIAWVAVCCRPAQATDDDESHDYPGLTKLSEQIMEYGLCASGTHCIPLNTCILVKDLMDHTCLSATKLRELACGFQGAEPMVCCPPGGNYSPYPYKPSREARFSDEDSYIPVNSKPQYYPPGCPPVYHDPNRTPSPHQPVDTGGGTWGDPQLSSSSSSSSSWLTGSCGQPIVRNLGEDKLGTQPWVARVGFLDIKTRKTNYACLGAIISPTVIVTSAKCANASNRNHYLSTVRVGEYDSKTNPDCNSVFCASPVQVYRISKAVIHGGYNADSYKDNIALIILNQTMQFNVAAQPICVLQSSRIPLEGRRGFLVGWGRSTNVLGQEVTSSRQQQIELPIVSLAQCAQTYGDKVPITGKQLCAGGEKKKDACTGFTGAPLVLLEHLTHSRYYMVGIMSFGSDKCGQDGVPSVFTSIHHYVDWIKKNME